MWAWLADEGGGAVLMVGEEGLLGVGARVVFEVVGGCGRAVFAEEFLARSDTGNRRTVPFFLADDAVGPGVEVNAHGLGEAAHYVEGSAKPVAAALATASSSASSSCSPVLAGAGLWFSCNRGGALSVHRKSAVRRGVFFECAG